MKHSKIPLLLLSALLLSAASSVLASPISGAKTGIKALLHYGDDVAKAAARCGDDVAKTGAKAAAKEGGTAASCADDLIGAAVKNGDESAKAGGEVLGHGADDAARLASEVLERSRLVQAVAAQSDDALKAAEKALPAEAAPRGVRRVRFPNPSPKQIMAGGVAVGTVVAAHEVADGAQTLERDIGDSIKNVEQNSPELLPKILSELTRPATAAAATVTLAAVGCALYVFFPLMARARARLAARKPSKKKTRRDRTRRRKRATPHDKNRPENHNPTTTESV